MSRATSLAVALLAAVTLSACSGGDGGAAGVEPTASAPASASPTPTSSPSPSPTELSPQAEFAAEVDELYALVKDSIEGSSDYSSSAEVLAAFATTVALVRVEGDQTADRQRVVDAAEAAAQSYRTAAGITGSVERTAAARQALTLQRELEHVIRTLPR